MTKSIRNHGRTALFQVVATSALGLLLAGTAGAAGKPAAHTYRVTIQNLMPMNSTGMSQNLTPALVVVHDRSFDLFSVGQMASESVSDVAEDGITLTGTSAFANSPGVEAVSAEGSSIAPGASYSFDVQAKGPARLLSLVTMLGNTNDAFTGLDAIRLTGGTKTYRVLAYDAGSEMNDQLLASISGSCCSDVGRHGVAQSMPITFSTGIQANTGDLTPAVWGWPVNQPVALITIEQVRK